MNDDHDLEAQLRSHLHGRADQVHATTETGGSLLIREDARRRTATRHRRRMATASVATAAAVAVGLVVIARDPGAQDVRTGRDQAASDQTGLAAGAATGSSTGSSSGSPTGWTSQYGDGRSSELPDLALRVPEGYDLIGEGVRTSSQGVGERAADLAVAADVRPGVPLRFIVASVQDARRLQSGKGGTETTILGRHARIISQRAATTLTWDVSDTERVLVTTTGVDEGVLTEWLAGLAKGASGQWAFSATGAGGLSAIPTVTPTESISSYSTYQLTNPDPDGSCFGEGYDLSLTRGGTYDLWGSVADNARWGSTLPTVSAVSLAGHSELVVAFQSDFGEVAMLDGDVLIRATRWNGAERPAPPAEVASLVFTPTEAERQQVVDPDPAGDPDCNERKGDVPPATVPPGGEAEPALTTPPATEMTTTTPPTTTQLEG